MTEPSSTKIPLEPYEDKKEKPKPLSKEFFKRWKAGMKGITPLQQLKAKMTGHGGTSIGMSIAFAAIVYRLVTGFTWLQLGFGIFIFFIAWLQVFEFIGAKQKYKGMKELMKEVKNGI
ncbi:unnamed protein product [marine sediment metagenome]|uniref:Uncharacterized protein n=1 Tax=marine sediment metagenome TaxID=412755 RepID=X0V9L5_9ZZZZ